MKLKKFEYTSKFIGNVYINPDYVTSVTTANEDETETLIYLTNDQVVRVKGKVTDVIYKLTGQIFDEPLTN